MDQATELSVAAAITTIFCFCTLLVFIKGLFCGSGLGKQIFLFMVLSSS